MRDYQSLRKRETEHEPYFTLPKWKFTVSVKRYTVHPLTGFLRQAQDERKMEAQDERKMEAQDGRKRSDIQIPLRMYEERQTMQLLPPINREFPIAIRNLRTPTFEKWHIPYQRSAIGRR